jgi:hypothetical protein
MQRSAMQGRQSRTARPAVRITGPHPETLGTRDNNRNTRDFIVQLLARLKYCAEGDDRADAW